MANWAPDALMPKDAKVGGFKLTAVAGISRRFIGAHVR